MLTADLAEAERETGVPLDLLRAAALAIGQAALASTGRCLFVTGLGLSELTQGTDSVMALCNLAMLTGSIGRSGGGMLPLRGQNNVQGNADMGGMPDRLTGYQRLDDASVQARVTALWGRPAPLTPGLTIPEMLDAARSRSIRGLWIQGEDVAQSDPNEKQVRAALTALDLLVVQELFLSETASTRIWCCRRRACWSRMELSPMASGAFSGYVPWCRHQVKRVPTGTQHRRSPMHSVQTGVTRVPRAVMDEIAQIAPTLFGGVSYSRLDGDGLQWPCPDTGHPGTSAVHAEGFVRGRGRLMTLACMTDAGTAERGLPASF